MPHFNVAKKVLLKYLLALVLTVAILTVLIRRGLRASRVTVSSK